MKLSRPRNFWRQGALLLLSFGVVAFGQPAWHPGLGLLAACIGFALFWRVLLDVPARKARFGLAMGWFGAVQLVQLSWFLSHPYAYIYGVLLFCALLLGAQWGLLALGITYRTLKRPLLLFALAGAWTLLEWSRLFLLSGLPFNPVGLTLSGSLYSLQGASIGGIYGLSFWVILTNLLVLRAWMEPFSWVRWGAAALAALLPYGFGWVHLQLHRAAFARDSRTLSIALVQSALPIEENISFRSAGEARQFVLDEWRHVLATLRKQRGEAIQLIVLPENLVPYGTHLPVFWLEEVEEIFQELFDRVPEFFLSQRRRGQQYASNASVVQALADLFDAHVVIGLEDSLYDERGKRAEAYSAAFHFRPGGEGEGARYEKRVLVPMGEYIPFSWCGKWAARYGVGGSFTPGREAKVFPGPIPLGISICYEEIYGHLMRENRLRGAQLLLNVTNDGWYPHSRLPKQHFDHARLRSVENGIPLARACNTGVTGAVDSFGRVVGILGEGSFEAQEAADSLRVDLPLYHYSTLYARLGDWPVVGLASFFLCIGLIARRRKGLD